MVSWGRNLTKNIPFQSWDSGLSNGWRISVWGHHHQKLWSFRNHQPSVAHRLYGVLLVFNFMQFSDFRNRHNFWWWCPQTLILQPMESPESQLSNGTKIIEFGYHHRNLWRFQIRVSDFGNPLKIIKFVFSSKTRVNILIFVIFNEFPKSGTRIRNRHNFRWWCPQTLIFVSIKCWESGLSIGWRISVWGHHHRTLWRFRNETKS